MKHKTETVSLNHLDREKVRALAADVQAARLEMWGRRCGACGKLFVPDNLRQDMTLKICPRCLARPIELDIALDDRKSAGTVSHRGHLRDYGLEWD